MEEIACEKDLRDMTGSWDTIIDQAKKKWEDEFIRKRTNCNEDTDDYRDPPELTADNEYEFEGNFFRIK